MIEELAWGDSPIAWVIMQAGFFAGPVLALGSDEQKARWLPPLAGADAPTCSVAITEPGAGSDAAAMATHARRVDGGYVLDGHKKFIGNAPIADLCVVFATVAPGHAVEGRHGVRRRERRPGLRARRRACRSSAAGASPPASCTSRAASSPTTAASARRARASAG